MLEITRIKQDDAQKIDDILKLNNISKCSKENCMAIYDGQAVTGIASYERHGSFAVLENNVILTGDPGNRLKDGLIRALMNMADLQGVRVFIIESCDDSSFYENMGFKSLAQRDFVLPDELRLKIKGDAGSIYTMLPDFFEQGCKSCGSCKK